ncbi:MAG: phosphotransferase, partial [Mycobacteriales bacterium]
PRVLELTDGVLWLSAVPGRPLLMEYLSAAHLRRRAAVTADFARAATWLDDLHAQTRDGRLSLRELTGSLEAAFAPLEGAGPAVVSLLDEARESLARWCPSGVPATAVHGDFWMGNLLVDRHRVTGVVDLELSAPRGLPMLDVLKLPLSYSLYLDAAGRVRPRAGEWPHLSGFQEVFLGTGYLARSAEAFVRGRLHRLGIPHEALRAFLPLVLAQQHQLQRHDPVASVGYLQLLRTLARHRSSAWSWRSLS